MSNTILLVAVIISVWHGDAASSFTCQEPGIFANTDENDCKTYVVCSNTLESTVSSCSENTYFWPEEKGCFSRYDCATNSMPGNKNPCEDFSYDIPDEYSLDCTQYIRCDMSYESVADVPQVISKHCPTGSCYRPGYGCDESYKCVNYECKTSGNFENPNDCSSYIKCTDYYLNKRSGHAFRAYYPNLVKCPAETKFNPFAGKCDSFYNCDGIDPNGGMDPCINTTYGNQFVPNIYGNPATYIKCLNPENSDVILQHECPAGTLFSPFVMRCYASYDPNETCSKDPCNSGRGKYVNYLSGHCNSFIECREDQYYTEVYEPTYEVRYCSPGTRFSPETLNCTRQYVCPTFPVNYCYPQTRKVTRIVGAATTAPPAYDDEIE